MRVVFEKDPSGFMSKNKKFLCEKEAEHNLILSLAHRAEKEKNNASLLASVLDDDDHVILSAVQMGGHNIVLSQSNDMDAPHILAREIAHHQKRLPGIVGPSNISSSFSDEWTETTGQKSIDYMDQIIYALTKVTMPNEMPEGQLRRALPQDKKLIAKWLQEFAQKVLPVREHLNDDQAMEKAVRYIDTQLMFVWDVRGKPVSQVGIVETESVTRIGAVYTPDEHRGHGYASAAVAHISQRQIDAGKKRCCLYADATNPVSNSIYRKIGYEFVGRSSMYVLE